ncbi:Uu.00g137360.m01.CDS01 [Anthostomella pinea]|uniref:Uu.00g137360.m01.CDS01 n=1 Tax=Anthostomella pinea TaxID=933095 RepID=A0AAI8VJ26_9PEZI|nr:Uu.00g137360.m01.CDS01 [Anthostomella pinea]
MEHQVERRPFEPGLRAGGIRDAGWKRLWARLSKDLGVDNHTSQTPSKGNDDSETDLSGYNTYAPTPEPREPTPLPDDPWERLEYDRGRLHWDKERYQFGKIFLNESLIDGARTRNKNEPGDRQARKKRETMESFRYVDPARFSLEYRHFQGHIDLPKKGWTQEEINAMYDAEVGIVE